MAVPVSWILLEPIRRLLSEASLGRGPHAGSPSGVPQIGSLFVSGKSLLSLEYSDGEV